MAYFKLESHTDVSLATEVFTSDAQKFKSHARRKFDAMMERELKKPGWKHGATALTVSEIKANADSKATKKQGGKSKNDDSQTVIIRAPSKADAASVRLTLLKQATNTNRGGPVEEGTVADSKDRDDDDDDDDIERDEDKRGRPRSLAGWLKKLSLSVIQKGKNLTKSVGFAEKAVVRWRADDTQVADANVLSQRIKMAKHAANVTPHNPNNCSDEERLASVGELEKGWRAIGAGC